MNKMLEKTGMLENQSYYNGSKSRATILAKAGIKHDRQQITQTCVGYIDKDTVKYDSYPACKGIGNGTGIIIRANSNSADVISFGAKIKFTPNRIIIISGNGEQWRLTKGGATEVFRVSDNVRVGKYSNQANEEYARQYWEDVENGLWDKGFSDHTGDDMSFVDDEDHFDDDYDYYD